MSIETGGSAFPIQASEYGGHGSDGGMSLRDYFAAKALQGMLSGDLNWSVDHAPKEAYRFADAMLEARKVQS